MKKSLIDPRILVHQTRDPEMSSIRAWAMAKRDATVIANAKALG